MCGIGGYAAARPEVRAAPALETLLSGLRIRGPDDEGVCLVDRRERTMVPCRAGGTTGPWAERLPPAGHEASRFPHDVALVNARYAVIDRTPAAHQPFVTGDGSVVATVNGEIFNYRELRAALERERVVLRTAGDTEVLAEGYRLWGDEMWERLNGFWAVALVDLRSGELVLARDRLGVAPLYCREWAGGFWFASLIRPILAATGPAAIERDVVAGFLETGLKDFDGLTCYEGVRSLPPATAVSLPPGVTTLSQARTRRFWEPPSRRLTPADLSFGEAVTRFRDTFFDAVSLRLRADIPVACELSGGLDSSSIAAAAAEQLGPATVTYTISVPEEDEEPYARGLRARYGHDYRVLHDVEERFLDDAERFTAIIEEPYHSPNIYTHYRMRARMKQDGIGVALTGSGGDEVLAGYEWDFWPAAAAELRAGGRGTQWAAHHLLLRLGTPGRAAGTLRDVFRRLRSTPPAPAGTATRASRLQAGYGSLDLLGRQRFHLEVAHLPYYLRSNDHFTMALPLEHRLPFLDYRLVNLGLSLPAAYLFRRGWTKYVLRKAMEPFLPRRIVWRREKRGFPFPLRRFLSTHRAAFAPLLGEVKGAGLPVPAGSYADESARDPVRLWRACSTGLWLRPP
jgi:asparagine synthase (glutamine-hydrolysing)